MTTVIATGNYSYDLINIEGSGTGVDGEDASVHLEDEYVPVGATEFSLTDASGFAAGDKVGDASTLRTQHIIVPTTAPTAPTAPTSPTRPNATNPTIWTIDMHQTELNEELDP